MIISIFVIHITVIMYHMLLLYNEINTNKYNQYYIILPLWKEYTNHLFNTSKTHERDLSIKTANISTDQKHGNKGEKRERRTILIRTKHR